MKLKKICKSSFIMATALAAVFALAAALPCTTTAAGPAECGLIGTWDGNAGSPIKWLAIHTAGSTITKGEMVLHWVRLRDYLLKVGDGEYILYPDVTRLSDGHGVWEMIGNGRYEYTWYAYGISKLEDRPLYSVRVSGIATSIDCDNIAIDFLYEVFDGFLLPQAISDPGAVRVYYNYNNDGRERRVPLTVVTPPAP